jgi:Leucine-rich repeat (LRR) protein
VVIVNSWCHFVGMQLKGLKRKSLLQDLGDGLSTSIGMHDLWREFGVMESKVGELEGRRWVYEEGGPSTLEEGIPSGGCWQSMKRMCFLENGLMSAKTVTFAHFSNISVLKLIGGLVDLPVNLVLDLSKMKHLKSLELSLGRFGVEVIVEVVGLGLVEGLQFLLLKGIQFSAAVIDDIGHLTKLQVLDLENSKDAILPDVSKLICLEEVHFLRFRKVATIFGFSPRMSNLRTLDFNGCEELRSLEHGVGELVALWELSFSWCRNLNELPNLQKLTNLRILNITLCNRIKSVPGLDSLVALERLEAMGCSNIVELPNLQKLTSLRNLNINRCHRIKLVPGLDYLVALELLSVSECSNIVELPNLQKLISLQTLDISQCRKIKSLQGLGELVSLQQLMAQDCSELTQLPNMSKLSNLQVLNLSGCLLESAPGMDNLIGLEKFHANFKHLQYECDQPRWSLLEVQDITGCSSPKLMMDTANLFMLESLKINDCMLVDEVLDYQNLKNLQSLDIANCEVKDMSGLSGTTTLVILKISGCHWLERLPNMEKLIKLKMLSVRKCDMLQGESVGWPC